jgi:hypothetical protein
MAKILGGVVLVAGIGLWIGNVSGQFRTFPLAGYLTILVGGAIMRAGE